MIFIDSPCGKYKAKIDGNQVRITGKHKEDSMTFGVRFLDQIVQHHAVTQSYGKTKEED